MESDADLAERVRLAERSAAAPYIDAPPSPWWYPVMLAYYAGALAMMWGAARGDLSLAGEIVALVGLLAAVAMIGAWYRWERERRGTWPRMWRMKGAPREIRRVMSVWFVGYVVLLAIGVALVEWLSVWVGAVVVFALAYLGTLWYERVFARAAARVRERLG